MKPELLNKELVYRVIERKKSIINNVKIEKNNLFFNFMIILFFVICGVFLLFRYLDKKNTKKNLDN